MNAATILLLAQVIGQPQSCMPHDDMVRMLERRYQETPEGVGLNSEDYRVELFTSPDRTTWTIVRTNPDGFSCAVDAGEDWKFLTVTGGESA